MEPITNAPKQANSLGNLISLFGRKLKAQPEVAAPRVEAGFLPAANAQGRRILIVDDDPVFLKATEMRLKARGYSVSTAVDGPSALEAARTERPEVVLLDLNFPATLPTSWDGFGILEWLVQMNWVPKMRVIICTASQTSDLMQRAAATCVNGVFYKPLDYASLLIQIESQFGQN